jgi:hypothetical protein
MSQQTHFIPPLTIPDADDARLVWLAMQEYKLKLYSEVTTHRAAGDEGKAQVAAQSADRAEKLSDAAYVQYRDAKAKAGQR